MSSIPANELIVAGIEDLRFQRETGFASKVSGTYLDTVSTVTR